MKRKLIETQSECPAHGALAVRSNYPLDHPLAF